MVAGALGVAVAWRLVSARRISIWPVMTAVVGVAAALSLLTGEVKLSANVRPVLAAAAGLGAGAGLYLATAAFLLVARRVPVFERGVREIYDQRRGLTLATAIVLAAVIVGPCEEIFWRGLFQWRLSNAAGAGGGAALTLIAYAAANAASASLPIALGAIVSGAVWGGLAWWTGGVMAGVLCHMLWTGLMVAFPPRGEYTRTAPRPT